MSNVQETFLERYFKKCLLLFYDNHSSFSLFDYSTIILGDEQFMLLFYFILGWVRVKFCIRLLRHLFSFKSEIISLSFNSINVHYINFCHPQVSNSSIKYITYSVTICEVLFPNSSFNLFQILHGYDRLRSKSSQHIS